MKRNRIEGNLHTVPTCSVELYCYQRAQDKKDWVDFDINDQKELFKFACACREIKPVCLDCALENKKIPYDGGWNH